MARGVNKVILVGNLGKDPEMKYTASGAAVCNITVATSESWNDKQTGEKVEKTEWHRVVSFQRLAEIMGEWLRKGSQVYIEGKLQTRKWQDQNGQDRYTTEIVANQMQMLGSKAGGDSNQEQSSGFRKPDKPAAPAGGSPASQQTGSGAPTQGDGDFEDDDIPF